MLKKAGIAVAAAAAGLLAFSPLAFAGTAPGHGSHGNHNGGHGNSGNGGGNVDHHSQKGLVNVQDNVIQANVCDNNVNVLGIQVTDITAALGLLSSGDTTASDDDLCVNESDN